MTTLPGQSSFEFAEPLEAYDTPEVLCRACGGRCRFKGKRNRTEVYECSEPSCGLLFEVMIPGKPISTSGVTYAAGRGPRYLGAGRTSSVLIARISGAAGGDG